MFSISYLLEIFDEKECAATIIQEAVKSLDTRLQILGALRLPAQSDLLRQELHRILPLCRMFWPDGESVIIRLQDGLEKGYPAIRLHPELSRLQGGLCQLHDFLQQELYQCKLAVA